MKRIFFLIVGAAVLWLACGTGFAAAQCGPPAGAPCMRPMADPSSRSVFQTAPIIDHLPNGLTVITVPWDSPGIVAYHTLVRTGSRDEVEPGHSGYAHLFEHMMFRGTPRYSEAAYEDTLERLGADNNAYTTQDFTLYYTTAPAAALETLVDMEADRFQNLQYTEAQYRTETGAVVGEYNKSASDPFLEMWEALSEMAFSRHTYGHTTLGYLRDIQAMPEQYDYSVRFLQRFYTPDNCTVVVVGDVDRARLLALVERAYAPWTGRRDQPRVVQEPEPRAGQERHIAWAGTSPPRMFIGYRIPAFGAEAARRADRAARLRETAALQVVHGLAFSESSELYQRLIVDEQRVLKLSSWAGEFTRDPHLFVVTATLKPETPFAQVRDSIQTTLNAIAEGRTPAERVAAVRSNLRYAFLMKLETPNEAGELIAQFLAVGGDLASISDYLAALEAVTVEDVQRVARRYLTTDRRFVVTLAPSSSGGAQ